jgi:hypothetical protein
LTDIFPLNPTEKLLSSAGAGKEMKNFGSYSSKKRMLKPTDAMNTSWEANPMKPSKTSQELLASLSLTKAKKMTKIPFGSSLTKPTMKNLS